MRRSQIFLLVLPILAAGCGGGGQVANTAAPPSTITSGSVEATGTKMTTVVASAGSTVYGIAGDIARAQYRDPEPSWDETEVVISHRDRNGTWLSVIGADGTGRRELSASSLAALANRVEVDSAGNWVYFTMTDGSVRQLFRTPFSGGTPTMILSDCFDFDLNPSGTQIIYRKNVHNGWWRANAGGGAATKLNSNTTYTRVWGCLSDTFVRLSNYETDPFQVGDMLISNGGFGTLAGQDGHQVRNVRTSMGGYPQWGFVNDTTGWYLFRSRSYKVSQADLEMRIPAEQVLADFATPTKNGDALLPFIEFNDLSPSPDGRYCAFATRGRGNLAQITDGASNTLLIASEEVNAVGWGPQLAVKALIGGTGAYSGGGGIVLFSERGTKMPSVVIGDAVTRNTSTLTQVSSGGSNIVFRWLCDTVKTLHFSNVTSLALTTVVNAPTNLKGAFLSFDAETGKMTSIVTFNAVPNAVATAGGVELQGGEIAQVIGADGVTRKPNGVIRL